MGAELKNQMRKAHREAKRQMQSMSANQAKVNAKVNAELSEMRKNSAKREADHLNSDAALKKSIAKCDKQTARQLKAMAEKRIKVNAKLSTQMSHIERNAKARARANAVVSAKRDAGLGREIGQLREL